MIALKFDIGNTHTHIGLANSTRVCGHIDIPTKGWGIGCRPANGGEIPAPPDADGRGLFAVSCLR